MTQSRFNISPAHSPFSAASRHEHLFCAEHKRILLEMMTKKPDVQQLLVKDEVVSTEQHECSSRVSREGRDPRLIKAEEDEVEEEVMNLSFTTVKVKIEEVEEEDEPPTGSLSRHIKTEDNRDDYGGPESDNDTRQQRPLSSGSDTDDSEDWRETSNTQSSLDAIENPNIHATDKKDMHEPLICSVCGRKCSSKSGLTKHMKACSGGSCSVCGKSFNHLASLQVHMKTHRTFFCSLCSQGFFGKAGLRKHMAIHSGEKPFNCSHCGKCFTVKASLNTHMRIHTKEKPFTCSQCDKGFTQKGHLTDHMRIHTGEKPFICPQCSRSFRHRQSLEIHMRIHTGEKPFFCSECGKRFTQRANLIAHMKFHT